MSYQGSPTFNHQQQDKIGVLITNLGTPDAPTKKALKRYLKEFLSDPRVVEMPKFLWWFILNGIILRIRPKKSAKSYQSVWTDKGSPLSVHTQDQLQALRQRFNQEGDDNLIVEYAMRYGSPSISSVLDKLFQQGVRKLLVLPLYPQYSASTTASTFDAIADDFVNRRWLPDFRFISHYHDFDSYIEASAHHIKQYWKQHGRADKLIFSYHGLPVRYLYNGDPYHCQCHKSSRLIAGALGINETEYLTTFQSRFGREEWLKPYTDETLKSLPEQGCKSVQIFCPGFASDCLETIEEIGVENRGYFLNSGGERYEYISALNAQTVHIDALEQLIRKNLVNWSVGHDTVFRAENARKLGAPY